MNVFFIYLVQVIVLNKIRYIVDKFNWQMFRKFIFIVNSLVNISSKWVKRLGCGLFMGE